MFLGGSGGEGFLGELFEDVLLSGDLVLQQAPYVFVGFDFKTVLQTFQLNSAVAVFGEDVFQSTRFRPRQTGSGSLFQNDVDFRR